MLIEVLIYIGNVMTSGIVLKFLSKLKMKKDIDEKAVAKSW